MKIQVNVFDPDSVDIAIAEVNKYKRAINEKVKEIVTELGMRGRQIVDNQYSILEEYEIYEVDCIVNGTSAMIIAEGDNVVFLEFGGKILQPAVSDGCADFFVGQLVFPDQARGMFHPHLLQVIHQLFPRFLVEYTAQVPGALPKRLKIKRLK